MTTQIDLCSVACGMSRVTRLPHAASLGALATLCVAFASPSPVSAQNVSVSISQPASLQDVVVGTAPNTFTITQTGAVNAASRSNQAATRLRTSPVTPPRLTIVCTRSSATDPDSDCAGESIALRIREGLSTGGAGIEGVGCTIGQAQPAGVTYRCTEGSGSGPAYSDLVIDAGGGANPAGWTLNVALELVVSIAANAPRGHMTLGLMCLQAGGDVDSFSSAGCGNAVTGRIMRALATRKSADLDFGKIVRPAHGSGTITLSAKGARSASGNAGVLGISASQARFAVTGEGGQAITVGIPATFALTNGTHTLQVTTVHNLPGGTAAQSLGGTIGTDSTLDVDVGGTLAVTSSTPPGVYTGTLTLTTSYQ
jgi:hypothetical protein